jgi:TPR repeat protein
MMLQQSRRRLAFAVTFASCCVLFSAPTKIMASPAAEPDIPSTTTIAPEPRNVDQQIKLAGDYLAGRGVAQNLKLAAYWYEKAAGAGDPQAELQIGYFYEAGIGVPKDPARAAHWYQLAASGGLIRAKVNLAVAYLWGTGVPTNKRLALKLLNEAAADGSGLAACYLGDFYAFGVGVPVDQAAAERWYRKGATLHDPLAEFDLGTLLFSSPNHTHDLSAAASFFRESAAAGYVPAMHSLGLLLVRNPALAQSPGEATELLNHAANAGNWRSSMLLGILARDGNGVPKDSEAAYYHFRVACLQGGDEAKKLLATDLQLLSAKLGSFQAQTIGSEAEQWFTKHHFVLAFVDREGKIPNGLPGLALAEPGSGEHAAQLLTSPDN